MLPRTISCQNKVIQCEQTFGGSDRVGSFILMLFKFLLHSSYVYLSSDIIVVVYYWGGKVGRFRHCILCVLPYPFWFNLKLIFTALMSPGLNYLPRVQGIRLFHGIRLVKWAHRCTWWQHHPRMLRIMGNVVPIVLSIPGWCWELQYSGRSFKRKQLLCLTSPTFGLLLSFVVKFSFELGNPVSPV